ncbi:LLM class flavin-dependent oxidoreductase [Streptomyces sp. NPDC090131]|uniref:LLM class flavin-dependent oxidoreductase n=1 Tax=Streptomyces sp. NPDC090131 TaxID=3365954 RepID=UPI0037FFF28B
MTRPRIGFGAFVSPLHPPGENPTLQMWRDLELIEWLDELGLEEAWIGEHHSGGWGTVGSPEIFLAAAAERTRHIRLGTGVTSLPYHHPFHVASRIVQLDHQTRGRVMLGVGAGSAPGDAHMLGIAPGEQRRMTTESLEAVLELLAGQGPVTRQTDWFTLRDARLQHRPVRPEGIEVAISSAASPHSMMLAGRHGISPLSFASPRPGGTAPDLARQWAYAEEAAAAAGRTVRREDWRLVVNVYVGESRREAMEELREGAAAWMRGYFGDIVGLPVDALGIEPGREIEALVESGAAIVGSPDEVAAGIEQLYRSSGGFGKLLVTGADWASRENAKRSFERLARFVVPRFNGSMEGFETSREWVMENRTAFVTQAIGAFQKAFTDSGVAAPQLPLPVPAAAGESS